MTILREISRFIHDNDDYLRVTLENGFAPDPTKELYVICYCRLWKNSDTAILTPEEASALGSHDTFNAERFERPGDVLKALEIRVDRSDKGLTPSGLPVYKFPKST